MRPALIALFVLSLLVASGAFARTVYKWKDDNGQINYTAEPPKDRPSQKLDLHTALPTGGDSTPASAASRTDGAGASKPADDQGDAGDDVPKGDGTAFLKKQCDIARGNVKALEAGGTQHRYRDANGKVVRYDAEQIKSKIAENRKYLETYCKQQ